jgi:D-Lysine 5,6-aminomutase TIM-barrel domain of alpha subunit
MPHLKLDQSLVDEARALALHISEPVIDFIRKHTTVAIERSTLPITCSHGGVSVLLRASWQAN